MDKLCRKTSKHGWLTSESTITWILNVDCVEHRRSFDDNINQVLEFRRQHGSQFEFFDDNMDPNLNFSPTTWIEI